MLEFGLCTCVLPCTPVLTQHTFTLTRASTHVSAQNSALTPNTSHSHSLPSGEPRATGPLTSRLPTEATGQATGFCLHPRPLLGPSAPKTEAAQAHSSHPPLPRKQASREGVGFKAEGCSRPHSFLPWSMERSPFAASNLKNERKEKKLECRKRYLAILGLSSPHKSRPLFPSLTASCHLGRPTGAILAAPLPGSLFE